MLQWTKELEVQQNNMPKRAIKKPRIAGLIICSITFIAIVIFWANLALPGLNSIYSWNNFYSVIYSPLPIAGLFLSYNIGISLAKINYKRVIKGKLLIPYLIMFFIQILCIAGAYMLGGTAYPLDMKTFPVPAHKICYQSMSNCDYINPSTVIMTYFVISSALLLPAYYAICRYCIWTLKYRLPDPNRN